MKQITIDLDSFSKVNQSIFIEEYLILYCKYYGKLDYIKLLFPDINNFIEAILSLESGFYIKITDNMFINESDIQTINLNCFELRDKAVKLFETIKIDLEKLAETLRGIFPPKIRGGGGKPVKSSQREVVEKLKKFFKHYNYTEDKIIAATINYINNRRQVNWAYVTQLDYFIFKDVSSMLAAEIESLGEDEEINVFEIEA